MHDTDVSPVLGPTITQLVRATTFAVAATGVLVLVIDLLAPWLIGSPGSWPLRIAAAGILAAALVTRRVDVRRALRTGENAWIIGLFPLATATIVGSLTPLFGQASLISLSLLLAVLVAGLTSSPRIAMVTLGVQAVAELWALWLVPDPDPRWTASALVVGAAIHWTSRAAVTAVTTSFERQREAMEEVERVAEARQDFVATVSHELRTPIHVVTGLAETLDEHWSVLRSEQKEELVTVLRRNGDNLRGLVDGLLDFTRLRSDSVELRPALFDLTPIADQIVASASSAHPDHTVLLESTGRPQVVGDPLLVERVVDNLVRNACNHTPAGTTVKVVASYRGHELQVEVADDGPGIAPEDLPRLTERFFRGGDHLSRDSSGFGLGLAFCAEVLELHGRRLEVASEPGHGATFAFSLPVAEAPTRSDSTL